MLTLHGAAGNLLRLRSSLPGTPWLLLVKASPSVMYTDVQDGDATGLTISDLRGKNTGDNTNWDFLP